MYAKEGSREGKSSRMSSGPEPAASTPGKASLSSMLPPGEGGARGTPPKAGASRDSDSAAIDFVSCFDSLSLHGEANNPAHLDQTGGTGGGTGGGSGGRGSGAATAVPTNLHQIVTSWTPGAGRYGFQLRFECESSTGSVADLQTRPNLKWREYVTYSRNNFAHRISPSNPTILPPGGIEFDASTTSIISANRLDLGGARDTHWMPTSAVHESDFASGSGRTMPAIMESQQVYQYSTDGSTWTTFAGPFTLRRTFASGAAAGAATGAGIGAEIAGPIGEVVGGAIGAVVGAVTNMGLTFTTNKSGIHSVSEPYKAPPP
jgi:hypothetical protein